MALKKFTVQTNVSLKINCGNYETIDVSKMISTEIECEPNELPEKSAKNDALAIALLKQEAEIVVQELGRRRIMKTNGVDTPVELWKSYVAGK
jgi:hypothetical protein